MGDASQVFEKLRHGGWVVLLPVLLSPGLALAYSFPRPPLYTATTTLIASLAEDDSSGEQPSSPEVLAGWRMLITTYCQILESQRIFGQAAERIDLPPEVRAGYQGEDPLYEISCTVMPESLVLRLRVQAPSPALAADLANEIGAEGVEYINSLQEAYELRVLDTALPPATPSVPSPLLTGIAGAGAGLVLGLVIIQLWRVLTKATSRQPVATSSPAPLRTPPLGLQHYAGQAAKILVVDDSEEVTEVVEVQLLLEGYQVEVASDGPTALKIAEEWRPDLILLDVKMPGMDGFEVARRMRQSEATCRVPIIMLTAKSSAAHRTVGFESGADDYIVKPFDLTDLSLRVAAHLRRVALREGGLIGGAANRINDPSSRMIHLDPEEGIAIRRHPYTNEEVVRAFRKAFQSRGEEERVEEYLMLSGLGHLIRPEIASEPYEGPDIMTLPNLRDDVKAEILALLEG